MGALYPEVKGEVKEDEVEAEEKGSHGETFGLPLLRVISLSMYPTYFPLLPNP